jgi:hypothetical protein
MFVNRRSGLPATHETCLLPSRHIQDLFNAASLGTETVMNRIAFLVTALAVFPALAAGLAVPGAHASSGGEQGELRRDRRAGNILPPREIERDILPRMAGMQYLGPEYDPSAMIYRLKFIKNGKVYFVDVDARSGRVVSQSR